MDNLSATALAARRAGMSYGKYVALHPNIIAHQEEEPGDFKYCPGCGAKFSMRGKPKRTIYCTVECGDRYRASKRYRKKKEL